MTVDFPTMITFVIGMVVGGIIRQKEIENLQFKNEILQQISQMYMEHLKSETTSTPLYQDENSYDNR